MSVLAVVAAVIVSALVGRFLYRLMFDDSDDFWSCVGFSLRPDLLSIFRGEYWEDQIKSLKFSAFMIGVIGSGILTYWSLADLLR